MSKKNYEQDLLKSFKRSADLFFIEAYLKNTEENCKPPADLLVKDSSLYMESYKDRFGHDFQSVAYVVTKGAEEDDLTDEQVLRRLSLLEMKKGATSATEALVIALSSALGTVKWHLHEFLQAVNPHLVDPNQVKMNNIFLAHVNILCGDIMFLEFAEGELVSVPAPFKMPIAPASGIGLQKESAEKEIRVIPPDEFDLYLLNDFWEGLTNSKRILSAILEINSELGADEFMQQLIDTSALIQMFMEHFGFYVEIGNDAGFLNTKTRLIESNDETACEPALVMKVAQADPDGREDYQAQVESSEVLQLRFTLEKSKQPPAHQIRIEKVDKRKGLVYGIVLRPGSHEDRDLQEQYIEAPQIEETMHRYMMDFQVLGEMHEKFHDEQGLANPDFRLIQNFIAPVTFEMEGKTFPKGAWIQEWQLLNPIIKRKALNGVYKGFSVGGSAIVEPDKQKDKV